MMLYKKVAGSPFRQRFQVSNDFSVTKEALMCRALSVLLTSEGRGSCCVGLSGRRYADG